MSLEHIEPQTGRVLKQIDTAVVDEGKSTTFRFDTRHVLYGKLRPYLNKVALPDFAGRCTTEMIPLLPADGVDRHFLAWLLRREETIAWALQQNTGARMPRADMDSLLTLSIPFPPLAEQERIAARLTEQLAAVERARAAAQSRLAAAESLPAAYLRETFEGVEAKEWESRPLGDLVSKIGSGITPSGGQASYVRTGVPLIRSQNVHLMRFEPGGLAFISPQQDEAMSQSRVFPGDVLLNITGASIGRVCVAPPDRCPANVNQHVAIIRSKPGALDADFLCAFFCQPAFQKFVWDSQSGATRQALTKEMIERFEVPRLAIDEQQRITAALARRLVDAERMAGGLRAELAAIEALPAALLRAAFGQASPAFSNAHGLIS